MTRSMTLRVATALAIAAVLALAACERGTNSSLGAAKNDSAAVGQPNPAPQLPSTPTSPADATATNPPAASASNDASITASVNAALARDAELAAMRIEVDTVDGKVALRGTAPNPSARERAAQIAQGVSGVRGIDNQLIVGKG